MPSSRLEYLFDKYFGKTCTIAEKEEFIMLVGQPGNDEALKQLIDGAMEKDIPVEHLSEDTAASILNAIMQAGTPVIPLHQNKRANIPNIWKRIASVAVLFLVFLTGSLFLFFKKSHADTARAINTVEPFKNDVLPGGDKAILTLADGSKIVLDNARDGALARQGNTSILKMNSGQLAYTPDNSTDVVKPAEILYNTISTPRGGKYMVVLPDGTRVWLNAVSSLRFPTVFTGQERKVEITGEAYFEVEKDPAMPFRVYISPAGNDDQKTVVEVLGTHFNVMAYNDENAINTTLLEGAVRIINDKGVDLMKPGQQSLVDKTGRVKLVDNAEVDEAVAWKNDLFLFNNTDIPAAMRQMARWYDVDVVYQGNVSGGFNGGISRKVNISQVLKMLAGTGEAHFKIEGKQVTVTP